MHAAPIRIEGTLAPYSAAGQMATSAPLGGPWPGPEEEEASGDQLEAEVPTGAQTGGGSWESGAQPVSSESGAQPVPTEGAAGWATQPGTNYRREGTRNVRAIARNSQDAPGHWVRGPLVLSTQGHLANGTHEVAE